MPQAEQDFGLTLELAHLVPDFVAQFYESGLVEDADKILFAQLDDLRSWLKAGGRNESELASEIAEVLLAGQAEAAEAASLEGVPAAVAMELGALDSQPDDEVLDSASLAPLLQLVVEEADSLQAWSRGEIGADFSVSLSFVLPQPLKHPMLKRTALEKGLREHQGQALIATLDRGRVDPEQLSGVINIDLYDSEAAPGAVHPDITKVTRVAIADARAGDKCKVSLSFHYPAPWAAYFSLVLSMARKRLNLK